MALACSFLLLRISWIQKNFRVFLFHSYIFTLSNSEFQVGLFSFQKQISMWICKLCHFHKRRRWKSGAWILATPDCHYFVEFIACFDDVVVVVLFHHFLRSSMRERRRREWWYNCHEIESYVHLYMNFLTSCDSSRISKLRFAILYYNVCVMCMGNLCGGTMCHIWLLCTYKYIFIKSIIKRKQPYATLDTDYSEKKW